MALGKRIQTVAKEHGLSIKELSRKADIPYTTLYSLVKRDSNKADSEALRRIAHILCVDTDYLQYGIQPLKPIEMPLYEGSNETGVLLSHDQELFAFSSYIKDMGYNLVIEFETEQHLGPYWTLSDNRENKKYFITTAQADLLMQTVNTFLKYQMHELAKTLTEVPVSRDDVSNAMPPDVLSEIEERKSKMALRPEAIIEDDSLPF